MLNYKDLLLSYYGILLDDIKEITHGWTARAYKVRTATNCYFLKEYDRTRVSTLPWINRMDYYIPVMVWLSQQPGLGQHIPHLWETLAGQYVIRQGSKIFLLFSYVEGIVPGEESLDTRQLQELATIMADLHKYSASKIPFLSQGLEEDLSLTFCRNLKNVFIKINELPDALQNILTPVLPQLIQAVQIMFYLRDYIRKPSSNLVLCHTDAHNWNLIQGDRLYLLDWEGLCLAPPEADLFFWHDIKKFSYFWEAYKTEHPKFSFNDKLMLYYSLSRKLQDLWEFIAQLLYDCPDDDIEKILEYIKQENNAIISLLKELPSKK